MTALIEEIISVPPPPSKTAQRREGSNRTLTSIYNAGDKQHIIDCTSSPCFTKCHFSNAELGEVIFDRPTEIFLASTKAISTDYLNYLKRAIRQWKQSFQDY
jgi:hypothetical protein